MDKVHLLNVITMPTYSWIVKDCIEINMKKIKAS